MGGYLRLVSDQSGGGLTRKGKVFRPVLNLVSLGKGHEKPRGVAGNLSPYRPHANGVRRAERVPGVLEALKDRLPSAKFFDDWEILHGPNMNKTFSHCKNNLYIAPKGVIANNAFVAQIGERLRERAYDLGMTDAAVARAAGLGERRYGHYVENKREPKFEVLLKICQVLKCTPDYLLGVAVLPNSSAPLGPADIVVSGKDVFRRVLTEILAAHQEAGTDAPLDEVVLDAADEVQALLFKNENAAEIDAEIAGLRSLYVRLLRRENTTAS